MAALEYDSPVVVHSPVLLIERLDRVELDFGVVEGFVISADTEASADGANIVELVVGLDHSLELGVPLTVALSCEHELAAAGGGGGREGDHL